MATTWFENARQHIVHLSLFPRNLNAHRSQPVIDKAYETSQVPAVDVATSQTAGEVVETKVSGGFAGRLKRKGR